ncbi:RNA dependent RNA polymerase-domain-containing protein [Chaetomium strumarium]|uniref:RNA-directed RNA polymerase n=1 Tax=Chaetomium strumarium TaxID=1170767 RepID=A0AAJ0H388_9PEZI|nr:RNA dependent RNA polymerase-domain-containing protein [Chaetomium strumarium]
MADLMDGGYQRLLLEGVDNGRLRVQHHRAEARRPPTAWSRGGQPARPSPPARPLREAHGTSRPSRLSPLPVSRPPPTSLPSAWSSRNSVTMIVRGVPPKASPWDIRQFFERYGRVVWVEVDSASRPGARSAKVRFEPPPTDTSFFQQGECRLAICGTVSRAWIEFPKQPPEEHTLTTPLGNTCPASLVLRPIKLTFGILTQPTTLMCKREIRSLGSGFELTLTADFKRKKLVIHFPLVIDREGQHYRMDIKFGIIKQIYRTHSALIISLEDVPLFRKKPMAVNGEAWADRLVWGEDELWQRVVDIRSSFENPKAGPVSLEEKPRIIDLGRSTTYWMDLDKAGQERWSAIESHLHEWNVNTDVGVGFTQIPNKDPDLWDILADSPVGLGVSSAGTTSSWNHDLALLSLTGQISLPFDVRYQLEVCISRGILSEYNISRDFLEKLVELSMPSGFGPNRARLILEYAADKGRPIHNPMDLFKDSSAMTYYPATLHIPDYCALMRKVTVTPTRIYFSTPTVETTNRIIRRYKEVQEYFVRVQFTDELLEGRIRACEVDRDDELYARVYRVMIQGIRMGKWRWRFLAFGNSQIRECGAFFFCQTESHPDITCHTIRQWMGDFSHISNVAKLAARLGQCFSTTRLLHYISSPRIVKIDDVERGGFCFTDGVGKISMPLAGLVSEDWKLYPPPSAFQFRMGGCKGVLVAWPDAKGTEVHIRRSQEKFHAEYNGLEIIRCAQFSCATLNRQTILLLSCLGVPDEVFTGMMEEQISNYNAAMTDKDKAVELLTTYVDENMTTATIATMLSDGFMQTKEPFVQTLLQLWRAWSIKGLKEKARLVVDQGAFVLGCVDETGTLRGHSRATEGQKKIPRDHLPQIFLQVPDQKDRGAYRVITGLCLVGRNPSLHPGDIRVVEAVDVPRLRHLRDVVVFPLHGDRDIPSMLSGGDLDGDDYFVIWDPKLLPTEWGHPPMNYSAPKPLNEPKASTAKSLASFFVLFMKNDRLPLIAHAHLATADYEIEGPKHRKCLQLAELHSTAVDYVKTGMPAEWDKRLDPRKYPHFMEKSKNKSYHSGRVLGQLYDMVGKGEFNNRENYMLPFDSRILKRYQLGHELLKEARKIKSQYDIGMRRVMGQLEIRTEFEVWTSFVLSKPKVGSDYKVQERVGREAAGLKKQFRDLCLKTVQEHNFDKLEFVAAMYTVTWEEMRIALYQARQPHVLPDGTVGLKRVTARSMPLISFPWLFPNELGRIAVGGEKPAAGRRFVAKPTSTKPTKPGASTSLGWSEEPELDFLAAMHCTKTSDGQVIHRGETLHLFCHEDDGEEAFYCSGDVADSSSPVDATSEWPYEGQVPDKPPTGEMTPSDFPVLLDLGTALDSEEPSSSSSSVTSSVPTTSASNPAVAAPQMAETGGDSTMVDLLSSDTDAMWDVSPCLTPDRVLAPRQLNAVTANAPLDGIWAGESTAFKAIGTPPRSSQDGNENDATGSSKDDVEHEEEAIEVEGKTALERAIRLA